MGVLLDSFQDRHDGRTLWGKVCGEELHQVLIDLLVRLDSGGGAFEGLSHASAKPNGGIGELGMKETGDVHLSGHSLWLVHHGVIGGIDGVGDIWFTPPTGTLALGTHLISHAGKPQG